MSRKPIFGALVLAIILAAGALAAPITLSPTGDARGSLGALSGTGDASAADDCSYVPVPVALPGCTAGAAASGTGNATACSASGYGTTPCFGSATSLVGDADACPTAQPSGGSFPSCVGAAASGTGDASACGANPKAYTDIPGCVGAAASGTGDADACAEAEDSNWPFGWFACAGVAASATGDASACGTNETVTFDDSRCIGVAVSGCDVAGGAACTRRAEASVPTEVAPGPDADGDGFPASVTLRATRFVVDAETGNVTEEPDPAGDVTLAIDPDDADPNVPLAEEVVLRAPSSVTPGPDADGDGVPRSVAIEETEVTVRRGAPPNVTLTPTGAPIARVTLDANDQDPNVPAPSVVRASFPSNVTLGPDRDRDGIPSAMTLEFSVLTLDRRDPANFTIARDPARDQTVGLDPNDNNPNVPVQSIVSASVPSNVVPGPDQDGDGFPASVTVEFSTLTVDRRAPQNATLVRDPARDQRFVVDANDNDPNVPIVSSVSATFPSKVVPGPDADGDGLPATITIEFSRLTIDRRAPTNATPVRDPASDRTIAIDPDDGDFDNQDFVGLGIDGDAEGSVAAFSLTGDARACGDSIACLAMSGSGTARGYLAVSALGDAESCDLNFLCTAASGTGDASANDLAASGTGNADASYLAVSGTGDANGSVPLSALGRCDGRTCFSLDGDGHWLGAATSGDADGMVALTPDGNASGGLVAVSATGDASGGLLAVSGTGDADGGLLAASGTGDATAPVPIGG